MKVLGEALRRLTASSDFLEVLDAAFIDNGKINLSVWDYMWDKWAEALAYHTEPPHDDLEEYEPWRDSTVKHQVFSYWPTSRPSSHPNKRVWKGTNDLAWCLAEYVEGDKDLEQDVREDLEKAMEKSVSLAATDSVSKKIQVGKGSGTVVSEDFSEVYSELVETLVGEEAYEYGSYPDFVFLDSLTNGGEKGSGLKVLQEAVKWADSNGHVLLLVADNNQLKEWYLDSGLLEQTKLDLVLVRKGKGL